MKRGNYIKGAGAKLAHKASIDLHLAVISAVTAEQEPGRIWTYGEIAEVCGCHRSAIQQICERALRKLRKRQTIQELRRVI